MIKLLQFFLLAVVGIASLNVHAANYSLPADIGTGPFSSCSGAGPDYSCTAKVELNDNDTVVLTSDVTLNVDPEFRVNPGASASNGGFVFNVFVTGTIHIDGTGAVEINLTATGEIRIHKVSNITGNITSTGGDVLIEDDGNTIVGDVTAAGTLVIEGTSTVDGICTPTHPKCTGGGGSGSTCTTTQIGSVGEDFRGISGSSDSNVIAVGKNGNIYHYDGASWTKNAFTSNEDLRDIEVVNSNLAYAVGKNGKVVQYDGSVWSTLPAPTGEDLEGVWAISSTEVWVAGKNNALYLWNGSSWQDMSGGGQANVDNGEDLKDAWGNSSNFYTVEKDGDLYRYTRTGGPWSKFTACNSAFDMDAEDIWGDGAGNIYIAGKDKGPNPEEATVFLYNEGTNSCSKLFSTDTENKLDGISGNGSVVYGVGKNGLILDNSSGSWSESTQGSEDFKDVWVSSSGTAYYAGKNGFVTVCTAPASTVDHFSINPATVNASTCLPNAITIIAEDSSNNPVSNYANQIDITVSTNHGNWSINSANGVLNPDPDNDDNGAVSYTFASSDNSQIVLNLSNTHAESLTITVVDAAAGVSSTSVPITYSQNIFIITEDPIQVAGRPQAMTVAMWTDDTAGSGSCGIDTNYNSPNQDLIASIDRSGVLTAAADPSTGGVSIPDGPAVAGLTFDFSLSPGQASFNLDTTDVGQYTLTISDTTNNHSSSTITGTSSLLTVKTFGLAVTNIVAGATANPGANTPGGVIFTTAGLNFSARVAAVLWDGADDTNNDGVLDTGVYADNSVAPSYAWDTTLSVSAAGFTPATGAPGALNNATILLAEFSGGSFNVVDLQYTEVGSFTLQPLATDFLGETTADIAGDDIIVGRFIPASFQVAINTNGVLGDACGVYTYMGEDFSYSSAPTITVTALNALGATTTNYRDGFVKLTGASVSVDASQDDTTAGSDTNPLLVSYTAAAMANTPNNDGTVGYTFGADAFRYGPDAPVSFSKFSNSQVAPFVADINPEISAVSDTEVTTNFPAVTHVLDPTGNNLRFGRLRMTNTHGSELNPLLMPAVAEFWNATGFQINVLDTCTTIASADLVSVASPPGLSVPAIINSPALAGDIGITFPAPGAGNDGYIDTTTDLSSSGDLWLRFDWDNDGVFDNDPSARATFGIYSGNPVNIYLQQIYQ